MSMVVSMMVEQMYDTLKQGIALIKQAVEGLDPEVLDPSVAADLVQAFAEGERVCSAEKTLAAGRVDSSGAWVWKPPKPPPEP